MDKNQLKGLCVTVVVLLIFVSWLSYSLGYDRGYAKGKATYQGTLLPIEENRAYQAVIVLAYSSGRGENFTWHFAGGELTGRAIRTIEGDPIRAGMTYISGQGGQLRAVQVK